MVKSAARCRLTDRGESVKADIGTADLVIGLLAAAGVVVLLVVFVVVFRNVILKK